MVSIYNNMAKPLKINSRSVFTKLNIFQNNHFITQKRYVSVLANELRSGNIFFHNDKYCEVTEQRQIKQGRLATTNMISFIDLSTLKSSSVKFACQAKVDKIEPVKVNVHIQYTDKQKNIVVCMDQNYEDVEIPMNIFGVSEEYLEPGMEISVFKHEDKIIKVNLPSSLLATLRKK
ncbi:conserved Plasmodium protein, unknown function [Plasmodium chabaudi chabaudi]|uniref:Translation elongation factor P/YeiP central domain-containing protein n=1 Tax=Plasmodium chabaudi chabaudi TaxID=31271 RepID=A0A077TPP7_PLACU|nr:conserved Plasmodium protein, unknown function [Plasmodium chabaudi chabaudi]SCM21052.1 conserved Plasmodium protein, unknown function [Plasmodium chabaudi chabaudi]VTZ68355.1 conserved Plasmodium protein, unknown function [Plasmodium chabaudi chabaudi]|eukprot:XP_745231.2 conserved Plasmodium protein, unknown function [Plasmodium chabaudi chabaudi]